MSDFLKNQFKITVSKLGGLGDGIGEHEGKPVFVPKSCIGDELLVQPINIAKDHIHAEIIDIFKEGQDRVPAPCPHYAFCGGCSLQHLNEAAYQQFKQDIVTRALSHAGYDIEEPTYHFLPTATRRRVEFKVTNGKLAYLGQKSHELVPVGECLLLTPDLQSLIPRLNEQLPSYSDITAISLTAMGEHVDMLIHLASPGQSTQKYQPLAESIGTSRLTALTPDGKLHPICQHHPITIPLGNASVPLPPQSFLQATQEAQDIIISEIKKAIGKSKKIVDLFAGIGTYAFSLPESASIDAYELDQHMVDYAASIQRHVRFHQRDLFMQPLLAQDLRSYQAAIINPPRAGADAQIRQLAMSRIPRIVMVSCNPTSWSRDAKTLKKAGYQLQKLTAIDQFVFSPHLELVSTFSLTEK